MLGRSINTALLDIFVNRLNSACLKFVRFAEEQTVHSWNESSPRCAELSLVLASSVNSQKIVEIEVIRIARTPMHSEVRSLCP